MLHLAHLSDPHLGPMPQPGIGPLISKRITGYLSWKLRRHKIHHNNVLDALISDVKSARPDQIAITGDLINIALLDEFPRARRWLEDIGPPEQIALIPGNHDAYVSVPHAQGQDLWQPYMSGKAAVAERADDAVFPYIRLHRNIALIGTSSAIETAPFQASGKLGAEQLNVLEKNLQRLREQGFFRVLLIHHPPLPGQAITRKALKDAAQLKEVLIRQGVELVLHGHNHAHMHEVLDTKYGKTHIFGVPSASSIETDHRPAAAWNMYSISRASGNWSCTVQIRGFDEKQGVFRDLKIFDLYA